MLIVGEENKRSDNTHHVNGCWMVKIMNERRNGRKMIQEIMGQRRQSKRVAIFHDLTRYFRDDVTAAAADVQITEERWMGDVIQFTVCSGTPNQRSVRRLLNLSRANLLIVGFPRRWV